MQHKQVRKILKINWLIIKLESPNQLNKINYGISRILENTLYYCKKKQLKSFLP